MTTENQAPAVAARSSVLGGGPRATALVIVALTFVSTQFGLLGAVWLPVAGAASVLGLVLWVMWLVRARRADAGAGFTGRQRRTAFMLTVLAAMPAFSFALTAGLEEGVPEPMVAAGNAGVAVVVGVWLALDGRLMPQWAYLVVAGAAMGVGVAVHISGWERFDYGIALVALSAWGLANSLAVVHMARMPVRER